MAKSLQNTHWLIHVLRRVGTVGAEPFPLDPGTPAREAWAAACQRTGLSQDELAAAVAEYFRLHVATLESGQGTALKLVPEKVARQYSVFPLREDDRHLTVATSDPTNFAAEQALGFISGRKAVFEVAPPAAIQDAIEAGYGHADDPEPPATPDGHGRPDSAREGAPDGPAVILEATREPSAQPEVEPDVEPDVEQDVEQDVEPEAPPERNASAEQHAEPDAAPVLRLIRLILRDAVANGADGVEIEPVPGGGAVRLRIAGALRSYMRVPPSALIRVVSRIKVMGRLDIADRWRPQDGRTRAVVQGEPWDLRISTVPSPEGEKVVIRLQSGGAEGAAGPGSPGYAQAHARGPWSEEEGGSVEPGEDPGPLIAAVSAPVEDTVAEAEGAPAGRAGAPDPGMGLGGPEADAPILVVDDDPEDRLLVRTLLERHGFRVEEARGGEEALDRLGGDRFALVVLDLEMPSPSGREVLERMRAVGGAVRVPVIVLTGSPDPEDEDRVMKAGADDYLRKPVDPPRFVARVRATLRRARLG